MTKRKLILASLALLVVLSLANVSFQQQNKPASVGIKEKEMFQGLRTVIYHVDNLEKAKAWYTEVLGTKPYFDQPFYVGFNIGGFELGLDPDMSGVSKGNNAVAYWGVKDADASYKRMLELGAKKHSDVYDVGSGVRVATVTDPFGNVFGIIENPHFKVATEK
ncbi:MAG TPA: VOC family protein [Pyrinomonadaceae bacterium]|jgi:predicted enzyme related to lactoylglutathione lyase